MDAEHLAEDLLYVAVGEFRKCTNRVACTGTCLEELANALPFALRLRSENGKRHVRTCHVQVFGEEMSGWE